MDSPVNASPIPSSPPLPPYLSRHINLGFDSEDVAALVNSIESSQCLDQPTLPHLPAEIILLILEHIPIDYVLDFRRVCSGFRDCIDGRVMYSYLSRMELVGWVSPDWPLDLGDEDHAVLHTLRATFSHMVDEVVKEDVKKEDVKKEDVKKEDVKREDVKKDEVKKENGDQPIIKRNTKTKWDRKYAAFRVDSRWIDVYSRALAPKLEWDADKLLQECCKLEAPTSFDRPAWSVRLDHCVLDIHLGKQRSGLVMWFDAKTKSILVDWLTVLKVFIRTETHIRKMMEEKRSSDFTFGHHEDCLREVRRQRARFYLDLNESSQRRLAWQLGLLRPLFGLPRYTVKIAEQWGDLQPAEDNTIEWLMVLRKEAVLSIKERDHLRQLAKDRTAMINELKDLNMLFGIWKLNMYDPGTETASYDKVTDECFTTEPFVKLPCNPAVWSDETVAREEHRIRRWQSQKMVREAMARLLKDSHEALNVPEDAFDDMSEL